MSARDLVDASIAADMGLTVEALRARWAARRASYALPRQAEPELDDEYLDRCEVCGACQLFHPWDEDCPPPLRGYREDY